MQLENQEMLENFFNSRQTPKLLRKELATNPKILEMVQNSQIPIDFVFDLMAHMILAKRAPIASLVGLLKHHFSEERNPYQLCSRNIEKAVIEDFVDWDPVAKQVVLRFDVDDDTHNLLRQYQYLPPMTVPPLTVQGNKGSGYLTIKNDSLLLKDNHHENDICLDSINRYNKIPLSLNIEIAKKINNSWKNLDKPKSDELYEDFVKRQKAFHKYQKDAAFTMALMVEMGNKFYLTHKLDKRGRTYCQGYHITYQGNCWNKAVIEFANKEIIDVR